MLVTPDTKPFDFLKSELVRSPGLHASDIYGDLYKYLEPKRYDFGDEPPNGPLMALGTAWEQHFEFLLKANGVNCERPGELMSPEGIAYSPDLLIYERRIMRVGEIKLTSMDSKELPTEADSFLPPKYDKYLTQMKLYAKWLETAYGWLAILSIRKPWQPEYRAFNIEFNDRELQENHQMCISHARHAGFL